MLTIPALAVILPAILTATTPTARDARVTDLVAKLAPALIEVRHDLHQNPELGNREFRTAEKVAAHLRGLGLEVKAGIAHTGVVGILKGGRPGPLVAVRADMDALPVTEDTPFPYWARTAVAEFPRSKAQLRSWSRTLPRVSARMIFDERVEQFADRLWTQSNLPRT